MHFQTTETDIRKGWKYYRAWKSRFLGGKFHQWKRDRTAKELIYLAEYHQIMHELDEISFPDIVDNIDVDGEIDQKIAFMEAFLSIAALDRKDFEQYVRTILTLQSRVNAPKAFGFWFYQAQMEKFGAGVSPLFQGMQVGLFCENAKQLDFADISTVLPYDRILIRHPTTAWSSDRARKLVDHMERDLANDGIVTKIDFQPSGNFLHVNIRSPDYGTEMTAARLRGWRAAELYWQIVKRG
jgi:hypothetical protein